MNPIDQSRFRQASELLKQYLGTERHKRDIAERRQRQAAFADLLAQPFSEFTFSQVVRQLWAAQMWTNRDYLVSQILTKNGVDCVRQAWTALLSEKGTLGERYEGFVTSVRHMGPSMATEILCYREPDKAGIWNAVARQSLAWLYDDDPLFRKYHLSAKDYDAFNALLRTLGEQLPHEGALDLLTVDYMLWELYETAKAGKPASATRTAPAPESAPAVRSRHNELRDKVAEIGSGLGFDAEAEVEVAHGSKVDVVWRARIANLGSVAYVFEVQDKGSIDSLIVNLQQARGTLGAKKLCVVSDREQLDKIQKRVQTMPEELHKNLLFWEAAEVDEVFESLDSVTQVLRRVGLLE